MRQLTRYGSALLLGASLSLAACGGDRGTAGDTTMAAGGEPAMTPAPAALDSSAMTSPAGGAANLAGMSASDQLAVVSAANAAEVATSKAAEPKLTGDARSFARDMMTDHQQMQAAADQMARQANLTAGSPDVATQTTSTANDMTQQLAGMARGADLNRQYIAGQVQAHQQTLDRLQALQNSSDSTVKQIALAAIPKVQAHLQRAQRLQQSLGGTDSARAAGRTDGDTARP